MGPIRTEGGMILSAPQAPGGPLIAERHFQSGFGLWHAGGARTTVPYFFAVGKLHEVKRRARAAGYTKLIAFNTVSHRTTKMKEYDLTNR